MRKLFLSNCYRFKLKLNSINTSQADITSFMKFAFSMSVELKKKKKQVVRLKVFSLQGKNVG